MPRKSRTRRIGRGFTSSVAFGKLRRALTKQLEKCEDEESRLFYATSQKQNLTHNNNTEGTFLSSMFSKKNTIFQEENISPLARKLSSITIIYTAILISCVIVSFFHSILTSSSDSDSANIGVLHNSSTTRNNTTSNSSNNNTSSLNLT